MKLFVVALLALLSSSVLQAQWSPNTIPVVTPVGTSNCAADDQVALQTAISALPSTGGIVRLPACTRKDNVLTITKANVLIWGENRAATLFERSANAAGKSALKFAAVGGGLYGVRVTGDATQRYLDGDSNSIVFDHVAGGEVVGCDVSGSAVGVFIYGGNGPFYIEGNYVHHTWADHIHHTDGATNSWVWANFIFNDAPSNGDDGIACVTYGVNSPKCGSMEWWSNTILHTGGGRGLSVVGGQNISIHDNWVTGTAAAGILIASESSYNTATVTGVSVVRNTVLGTAQITTSHSGILISGGNGAAPPISSITVTDNTSYGHASGPYRAEGSYTGVTQTGTISSEPAEGTPTAPALTIEDTGVLRTRNTSFAPGDKRAGLYRIHVRYSGSEMSYEYVVQGEPGRVASWAAQQVGRGSALIDKRTVAGTAYAVVRSPFPAALSNGLSAVSFAEMRAQSWLWALLD